MPDTQNSKRFTVYEVQEVTDWRVYYYEIEAPSFEAAIAIVRSGDADPVDAGYHGEPEYNTRALGRSRAEAVERLGARLETQQPRPGPASDPCKANEHPDRA
jgi:hypothetical protein